MPQKTEVLRETDAAAIRLGKTLLRSARFGALAVLDPEDGRPLASRVGVATDADGTPIILVSMLSAHTRALLHDPRCSLLLGEPGKGDALAHPRISLVCNATRLEPGTSPHEQASRRYLTRNPKAKLYAGLGDFSFFHLALERASLNGGFGKAYALGRLDLIAEGPVVDALAATEPGAINHMNQDHRDAISLYAQHFAQQPPGAWLISGIDIDGIDLISGDAQSRIFFPEPLSDSSTLRNILVTMAATARAALRA